PKNESVPQPIGIREHEPKRRAYNSSARADDKRNQPDRQQIDGAVPLLQCERRRELAFHLPWLMHRRSRLVPDLGKNQNSIRTQRRDIDRLGNRGRQRPSESWAPSGGFMRRNPLARRLLARSGCAEASSFACAFWGQADALIAGLDKRR